MSDWKEKLRWLVRTNFKFTDYDDLVTFIHSLLASQKKELISKLEEYIVQDPYNERVIYGNKEEVITLLKGGL